MRQGNNKAKALSSTMSALFSKRIVAVSTMVRENNAALLLNGADLVADCTDNKEARDLIQKICIGNKIPCVHGCLDADSTMARIIWTDFFSSDEEDAKDQATCEDGRHLPFYGMVGAMMAYVIGQFFTYGIKESMQIIAAGKIIKLHTAR
jgi:hypothetical protein